MTPTDSRSPFRPDLPHGVTFVLSALIGAGVAGMLVLGLKVAVVSPPPPTACEALTARGEPCRGAVAYTGDLGAAGVRRLCGHHWQLAQQGAITLWDRPKPPPRPWLRWTAEDDARLRELEGRAAAEAARLLGRTPYAVEQRRSRLRRGAT